jgi:hypothetical protein
LLKAKRDHALEILREAIEPISEQLDRFRSTDFRARNVKESIPEGEEEREESPVESKKARG